MWQPPALAAPEGAAGKGRRGGIGLGSPRTGLAWKSVVSHLKDGVGVVNVAGDRVGQREGHGDQVEHRLVLVRPVQDGLGHPVKVGVLP